MPTHRGLALRLLPTVPEPLPEHGHAHSSSETGGGLAATIARHRKRGTVRHQRLALVPRPVLDTALGPTRTRQRAQTNETAVGPIQNIGFGAYGG
jgi:hypothetical protein